MRFDPQANFVTRTRTPHAAPVLARPPSVEARSPVKTAVVIVVIGFVAGVGVWLWAEGMPAGGKGGPATVTAAPVDSSIVQYAEAVISGKTGADRVEAATGESMEARLGGRARNTAGSRMHDEFREGQLAMGIGDNKKAVAHFMEAIRIDPNYADAHYRLGVAFVRLGNVTGARREQAFLQQLGDERAKLLGHLVDN